MDYRKKINNFKNEVLLSLAGFFGITLKIKSYSVEQLIGIANEVRLSKIRNYDTESESWIKGINAYVMENINKTDSSFEKKYKMIFFGLWLNQVAVNFSRRDQKEFEVWGKKLSKKLISMNVTTLNLFDIVMNGKLKEEDFKVLFEEDLQDEKKVEAIRKVYEDFKPACLLARNITFFIPMVNFLLEVQGYILTQEDINYMKNKEYDSWEKVLDIYTGDEKIIKKIIANEDNKENLQLIKDYFELRCKDKDIAKLEELFASKMQYLDLSGNVKLADTKKKVLI